MANLPTSGQQDVVDILVLGATGFTGRLVTRYLCGHPQRHLFTLAVGARSPSRLQGLFQALNIPKTVRLVQVDVTSQESLERAVKGTRVIINTVGPFWKWGTMVVGACVKNGVHYVDLTGETVWINKVITMYDYYATKTHAIIVPSCGYDSIPSDITAYLANKTLKAYSAVNLPGGQLLGLGTSTTAHRLRSGISGGTLSSVMTLIEDVPPEERRASGRPYSTSPVKGINPPFPRLVYSLPIPNAKAIVGGLFLMASTNTALVQRTFGLLEMRAREANSHTTPQTAPSQADSARYGPNFVYVEFMALPSKIYSFVFSTLFLIGFGLLSFVAPFRAIVKRFMTQPGSGPSDEQMQKGFLECTNITTASSSPIKVKTVIRAKGDPGYVLSAIMVSESALCMLLPPVSEDSSSNSPIDALPPMAKEGGLLTPMTAFGDVLIKRLRETGRFEFESGIVGEQGTENKKDI